MKIDDLTDVGSLQNETTAVQNINDNNQKIETAFQNTISRDGSTPNDMEADLNLNSNDLLNVRNITTTELNGTPIQQILEPVGEQGPVGETGPAGGLDSFRGQYSASTTYAETNIVTHEGELWVATGTSIGSAPSSTSTDWMLLVQKGANGTNGTNGEDGPRGQDGTDGVNSQPFDNKGVGAPNAALGSDGEDYLDQANGDVYTKAAGVWSLVGSARGPEGPAGSGQTDAQIITRKDTSSELTALDFSARSGAVFSELQPSSIQEGAPEELSSVTFTRASQKYTFGANNKFNLIPVDTLSYRYSKGERLGAEISPAITQGLRNNFTFGSGWNTADFTVTDEADQIIDGFNLKRFTVDSGAVNSKQMTQNADFVAGQTYTFGVIGSSRGAIDKVRAILPNTLFGDSIFGVFDFGQKLVVDSSDIGVTGQEELTPDISIMWITATATSTGSGTVIIRLLDDNYDTLETGDDNIALVLGAAVINTGSSVYPITESGNTPVTTVGDEFDFVLPLDSLVNGFTVEMQVHKNQQADNGRLFTIENGASSFYVRQRDSGDLQLRTRFGDNTDLSTTGKMQPNKPFSVVTTFKQNQHSGFTSDMWIDGVHQGTATGNFTSVQGVYRFVIGGFFGSDNGNLSAVIQKAVFKPFIDAPAIVPIGFGNTRIASLGPSSTYSNAFNLAREQHYTQVFADIVQPDAQVFNAGISGTNTNENYVTADEIVAFNPDITLMYIGNFFLTTTQAGSTTSVLNVADSSKLPAGWIEVNGESTEIISQVGNQLTVSPALSAVPAVGSTVAEDRARNVEYIARRIKANGCSRIYVLGHAYVNTDETSADTLHVEGTARDDERVAAKLGADNAGDGVYYVDNWKYFGNRLIAGLDTQGSAASHQSQTDRHPSLLGHKLLGEFAADFYRSH